MAKLTVAQRNAEYHKRTQLAAAAIAAGGKVSVGSEQLKFYKATLESYLQVLTEYVSVQLATPIKLAMLANGDRYSVRLAKAL